MTWTGKNEVLDEVIGRAELERMLDEAGATYTSRRIPAGAMVFWSGEPDGNHYYVESGSVELYGVDAAGRRRSPCSRTPSTSASPPRALCMERCFPFSVLQPPSPLFARHVLSRSSDCC